MIQLAIHIDYEELKQRKTLIVEHCLTNFFEQQRMKSHATHNEMMEIIFFLQTLYISNGGFVVSCQFLKF